MKSPAYDVQSLSVSRIIPRYRSRPSSYRSTHSSFCLIARVYGFRINQKRVPRSTVHALVVHFDVGHCLKLGQT